jgi:hypothetical protein
MFYSMIILVTDVFKTNEILHLHKNKIILEFMWIIKI